ncbi:hypothetical protein [Streptomyces sp. NPDC021212]|uniref:hypothetical protein n=1 Tax=Streptomyces sp. NPDC021212 TaxID=3365118 RepID=UPI0037B90E89
MAEFRKLVAEQENTASSAMTPRQEVQTLRAAERQLRKEHAREVRELRESINVLAQRVQFLTLENQRLAEATDQSNRVARIQGRR